MGVSSIQRGNGSGGHHVFGDGDRLVVGFPGDDSAFVLRNPYLERVDIEVAPEVFAGDGDGGFRFLRPPCRPTIHCELVADYAEQYAGGVPDMRQMVDRLSVRELFAAIERKLEGRRA